MQRLVEQPTDEGAVFHGLVLIGRVYYRLAVYQQFSEVEGEPVPAHLEVEGRITPVDVFDVGSLHRNENELTLQLADGRRLDFLIASAEGRIRSTGRGLYSG